MALSFLLPAYAAEEKKVTAGDQVEFQQKNISARSCRRLQERMFRLAEMIREAEPDDSAKLLLAVRERASS